MTTIATSPARRRSSRHFRDVVSAELTKFRSVRSSYWSLALAFLTTVGIGALVTFAISNLADDMTAADRTSVDPAAVSLIGLALGQIVIAAIGIRAITSEYSSGLIRTTLAAVPRRRTFLLAKTAVVGGVAVASGVVISLTSFLLGQLMLGRADLSVSLGDPGVGRALLGAGGFVGVVALVGLGLGTVIRHTGGT
jgi:ABC-2 type transport system permease protein